LTRVIEFGAVAVILIVIAYAGWFVVRVSAGVTAEVPAADRLIRLQVIDAAGDTGLTKDMIHMVKGLSDDHGQVMLLDSNSLERHNIGRTFVIARERDMAAARWLAEHLKLDDADIVYRPLENNHLQISVTLVIGEDCEQIIEKLTPDQEM